MKKGLLLLSFLLALCSAQSAVDVSSPVYPSSWNCIRAQGYTRAIIRAYQSSGNPDPVAPHTIWNAVAGGYALQDIDVYLFPCPSCGNAAGQVNDMLNNLANYNCNFTGTVWLDVEDTASHAYWGTDTGASQQFLSDLVDAASNAVGSERVGIYASRYMWELIFGDQSWDCCSAYPIWFADYDNNPDPNTGWVPFGGWQSPSAKQYAGDANVCGIDVDLSQFA